MAGIGLPPVAANEHEERGRGVGARRGDAAGDAEEADVRRTAGESDDTHSWRIRRNDDGEASTSSDGGGGGGGDETRGQRRGDGSRGASWHVEKENERTPSERGDDERRETPALRVSTAASSVVSGVVRVAKPPNQRRKPNLPPKDIGPGWCSSVNTKPPPELLPVVKSNKSSKKKLVWGASVDEWLVRRGFSILPELSEEELDEIAEVFRLLDDDDSGALDADELLEGFSLMGSRVDEAELRALIRAVDFDGSGEIEIDEFEVIMSNKKAFARLKGGEGVEGEEKDGGGGSSEDDDGAEDQFNSTWARGLRRKKMIAAIQEGGENRERMVRLAVEAEAENRLAKLEEEAAREQEAAKSGQIFGTQLGAKASTAVAAAAAAAAAAAQAAGLPPVPLKFLHEKGSGSAAIAALEAGEQARIRQSQIESRCSNRNSAAVRYDAWGNVIKPRRASRASVSEFDARTDDDDNLTESDFGGDTTGRLRGRRISLLDGQNAAEMTNSEPAQAYASVKPRVGDVGRTRRRAAVSDSPSERLYELISSRLASKAARTAGAASRMHPERMAAASKAMEWMTRASAMVAPTRPSFAQLAREAAEDRSKEAASPRESEIGRNSFKLSKGFGSLSRRMVQALALQVAKEPPPTIPEEGEEGGEGVDTAGAGAAARREPRGTSHAAASRVPRRTGRYGLSRAAATVADTKGDARGEGYNPASSPRDATHVVKSGRRAGTLRTVDRPLKGGKGGGGASPSFGRRAGAGAADWTGVGRVAAYPPTHHTPRVPRTLQRELSLTRVRRGMLPS